MATPVEDPAFQRYNWHPAVHTHFGETLYFYLISVKKHYRGPVAEQLKDILERAQIPAACEYTIYGHWDALIRVWLTSAAKRRLLRVLDDPSSNVDQTRHYAVHQIRHLWSDNANDLLAESEELKPVIAERESDIRLAIDQFDGEVDPDVAERLSNSKLLVKRRDRAIDSPDPVKFYVCLKTDTDTPQRAEERSVLAALHDADLTSRSSLYTGVGHFANYLIRCVADTYSDILSLTAAFDESLQDLDVRPMTLLIADRHTRESDNVNDTASLSPADESSLDLLELSEREVKKLMDRLTTSQRAALHSLVKDAYKQSEGDAELREKLRDLLRASTKNDRAGIVAATAFLLEFEWFLGEYLKRVWALAYGRDWIEHLAQAFATRKKSAQYVDKVRNPDQWSLGPCVNMAIASAEIDPQLAASFEQHLGPRWISQMRIINELRNTLAHGKLRKVEKLDDFSGEWGKLLAELMAVAALHYRCERLLNTEVEHDDEQSHG